MKNYLTFFIVSLILGCSANSRKDFQIIDTGKFEIEIPRDWKYVKEQGIDSFVGKIVSDDFELLFDWSEMGYANSLMLTEREYVYENDYQWMPWELPYAEEGVTYTTGNIEEARQSIMKKKGITDPSLVRVEPFQEPERQIVYKDGQYSALLSYQDTSIVVLIEIPEEIENHSITIDTIGRYTRKLISPKEGNQGMTGVYFEDLKSDFNFNLAGSINDKNIQRIAIEAFKSIRIKR